MLHLIWPHIVGSWGRLFPRQSPPGPCLSIRWFLIQCNESCETCPCIRKLSFSINVPVIFNMFLRHHIPSGIGSSGNVNVFQWKREWFFSRHVQFDSGFHVMTVNKVSWEQPEVISSFRIISCWVILIFNNKKMIVDVGWKKTRLILQEEFLVLLLGLGDPGLRWMFSNADPLQKFWLFHLRSGKWIFHLSLASFALSLRPWSSDASICSNSSMSATKMSPFLQLPTACNAYPKNFPGKTFEPTWCALDPLFRRNRVIFYHAPRWNNWAIEWHSEPPFIGCLPIRQKILNISQIAVPFHGIRPFFIQTWLQ